jgi:sialidase-1
MKSISLAMLMLCSTVSLFSQGITVFKSGEEGHKSYRIPAIVSLPSGELLAFAEGRVNDSNDFGDINLVMKRSVDKGATWMPLQMLVDHKNLQAGNPAPVVDLLDPEHPNGVLYLFYNTGNSHEYEVRNGKGTREVWYIKSFDGGHQWEAAVNITTQTHRPNQPNFNPAYAFKEDWRTYANTPGHAFQFQHGKYKGRIYVSANHSEGGPRPKYHDHMAHGYYTDDHGASFRLGASVNVPGSNEAIATEMSDSKMIMSIRNQAGDVKQRIMAISSDGGDHWDTTYFDSNLPDPVCQGSILTLGYKKGKAIIAHCNAADEKRRDNLTLKISYDEGRTWTKSYLISASVDQRQNNWSAYSDIVSISKKTIGVLFEMDNNNLIVFKTIDWSK